MIGCGINNRVIDDEVDELEEELGLPSEHAYSITRLACVNNKQLVRIRNPYGNRKKWKGAWSDNSKEWDSVSEDVKRRMSLRRTSDGEFWMEINDFAKVFHTIEVCNFSPGDAIEEDEEQDEEAKHHGKWYKVAEKGKWVGGTNSGGFQTVEINPQYLMTLETPDDGDKCSIVVTLMQQNELAISFFVYHVTEDFLCHKPMNEEFFKMSKREEKRKVSYSREVHCSFTLLPGIYLIVPFNRTSDSGEFLVRVFSNKKCYLEPYGNLPEDI